MRLVVFDLDTALCQSSTMDGLALAKAIKDVAGVAVEPERIGAIIDLKAIWYRLTQRVASSAELNELRERYSFHLRRQFLIRPSVISANYSLIEHVNHLQNQKNTVVGFVSNMTTQALLLKARSLGLFCDSAPIATGDDGDSLEAILQVMKTRVRRSFGISFESAELIAGANWQQAAQYSEFHFCSVEEFEMDTSPRARRSFFSVPSMALSS